jgi:DNA-binding MarR family transcriptional regulator/GNAT superfamily N-acetyltransferase
MEQRIASVRRFNRFYTRTIGVLGDGVQRTPYSLTEARLLFELAQADQVETLDLRQQLGLDPGYLSRKLARFEADGLVRLERSTLDGRRQVVSLTGSGRRAFELLNERAVEDMGALLERLDEVGQQRLLAAMSTIEGLWQGGLGREVLLREPKPGELGWVVQRHGEFYAANYWHDDAFEALVAGIVADYVRLKQPGRDAAWIAEVDGRPAGSIFCVHKDETTAQLRLLFVEPWARGMGVGTRLVDECVSFAAKAGYQEMVLWTNAVLAQARRIYERAGFHLVSEEREERYGGLQTFQNWSLPLGGHRRPAVRPSPGDRDVGGAGCLAGKVI